VKVGDNDGLGGVVTLKHLTLAFVKKYLKKIKINSKPTCCKFASHVDLWQFLARKKMIKTKTKD